jgi:hypothetical protein
MSVKHECFSHQPLYGGQEPCSKTTPSSSL